MWTLPTDTTWKFYGEKHPYYGVFGQDTYLNDQLNDQLLEDFFSSGDAHVKELFSTIRGKIDADFKPVTILDFGCGPGRFMIPFSKYANEVVGIDVSQKMLDEAAKNCLKYNVNNASFYLSDDNLNCLCGKKFDLVNSFIVLQHVHVKRGEKIIHRLIDSINENGIGVLHITYHDHFQKRRIVNYFRNRIPYFATLLRMIRSIIKKKEFRNLPQMQMNNYNLNDIFQLLQKEKVKEVYSSFTNHYDYFGITLMFKKNLNHFTRTTIKNENITALS